MNFCFTEGPGNGILHETFSVQIRMENTAMLDYQLAKILHGRFCPPIDLTTTMSANHEILSIIRDYAHISADR